MLQNDVIKKPVDNEFEKELEDLNISEEQKKLIIDFLWECAKLSIDHFLNQKNIIDQ